MGDEMDAMIPEREMKVREWPGPPSLPYSRRRPGAPPNAGARGPAVPLPASCLNILPRSELSPASWSGLP